MEEIENSINPEELKKELEETREKLRESEEKNRLLFQSIKSGCLLCDAIYDETNNLPIDYRIIECNLSFEKMIGVKAEEIKGKTILGFFRETGRRLIKECGQKIKVNNPANIEYLSKRLGKWLNVTAHPLGQNQVVTLVRDTTDQKRIELERQKIQKSEATEFLAGGIAHDFNNLLTVMLGHASLGMEFTDDEKQRYTFRVIISAINGAINLTQKLISLSINQPRSLQKITIRTLIEDVMNFTLGRNSKPNCDNSVPFSLWQIYADYEEIARVIRNLAINAKQAMILESGTICIEGENLELPENNCHCLPPGKYIHISFKDDGHGIPSEFLPKIFDPYASTKIGKGSGLGLSISRSIIERYGGRITAESEQGKGATFHIILPATIDSVPEEIVKSFLDESESINILIMDDNPEIRDLLKSILEYLGHTVQTSKYGLDAIEKYRKAFEEKIFFDLVILDLTIPGRMDGMETLKELRSINPDVKAIISSGYEISEKNGITKLTKPYGIDNVKKAIFRAMS